MSTAPRRTVVGAAALAGVCLSGLLGCSSGSGHGDDESRSPVLKRLGTLAVGIGKGQVTYLDAATARRLDKDGKKRFAVVGQPGLALLNGYRPGPWAQHLKADQIDTAIDARDAGRWEGSFDAAAITGSLKANGYVPADEDGRQTWKPAHGKGVALQVSEDTILYSTPGTSRMSAVHPENGSSLADVEEYRRAAGCLGDVYRADFNPFTPAKPVRLSALGQRADSAGRNTEVLCAVTKDEATARRLAARLRSVVRDKAPRYDGTEVSVEKGEQPLVRAVVPDTAAQRPGRMLVLDFDLWMAVVKL
ncbi:hypothetical protein [Streptomyces sp. SP2-10]|uniref:hypothetical protein n=1 Tax=Streptomyces sp. SP2-10 TaxID=2873385 RepID=UPI00223B0514|nr:hypothetical protein [Streptomyces sp. SP2-10]